MVEEAIAREEHSSEKRSLFRRRRARSGTSKTKLETKLVHRALTATTSELAPQVVWQKTAALCQWKLWARKKTTRYLTQLLFG